MPSLTPEEYEDLKEDIRERGVMVPIEYDEDGNILDGFNRKKICDELGITDYPTVIRAGLNEDEKDALAYTLNLARRHLTHEQKIDVAKDMAKRHPEWTLTKISKLVGIDKDVLGVQLEFSDRLDRPTGEDGKKRPANKKQAESQRQAIQSEIAEYPEKSDRQIAKDTGASPTTVVAYVRWIIPSQGNYIIHTNK